MGAKRTPPTHDTLPLKPSWAKKTYWDYPSESGYYGTPPSLKSINAARIRTGKQPYLTRAEKLDRKRAKLDNPKPDHIPKLNMDKAREIRELYATGEWAQQALAEHFGVTQGAITHIITNRTYKEGTKPGPRPKLLGYEREIAEQYDTGLYSQAALAQMYLVDQGAISRAIKRYRETQ